MQRLSAAQWPSMMPHCVALGRFVGMRFAMIRATALPGFSVGQRLAGL